MIALLERTFSTYGVEVSCETLRLYEVYLVELLVWSERMNLVGPLQDMDSFVARHFVDSHQLLRVLPEKPGSLFDLGSGAGFPGMIIALSGRGSVSLVEANSKKNAFLSHLKRKLCVDVAVICERVENIEGLFADSITARGFASLSQIFENSSSLRSDRTIYYLHKGCGYMDEVLDARRAWDFDYVLHPSITDCQAMILEVKKVRKKTT